MLSGFTPDLVAFFLFLVKGLPFLIGGPTHGFVQRGVIEVVGPGLTGCPGKLEIRGRHDATSYGVAVGARMGVSVFLGFLGIDEGFFENDLASLTDEFIGRDGTAS